MWQFFVLSYLDLLFAAWKIRCSSIVFIIDGETSVTESSATRSALVGSSTSSNNLSQTKTVKREILINGQPSSLFRFCAKKNRCSKFPKS